MTAPRALLLAQPPRAVSTVIDATMVRHGLANILGASMFSAANRHQSLSGRVWNPSPGQLAAMRRAAAAVSAHACTLHLDRIDSMPRPSGRYSWTLRARTRPVAFDALLSALHPSLREHGLAGIATGITPHVTLSYNAPEHLEKLALVPPIVWTIDELLLVIGGGEPYRYDIIDRWPLLPELAPPASQPDLFHTGH